MRFTNWDVILNLKKKFETCDLVKELFRTNSLSESPINLVKEVTFFLNSFLIVINNR